MLLMSVHRRGVERSIGNVPAMDPIGADESAPEPNRDDPRFHRLVEATRRAAEGGYDAVSMRDLAREAKMSLNTVYKFCSSKDQLIAEAHAERMDDFRVMLAKRPPRGDTAEKRVKVVLRGIARALEQDDVVTRTLMRSIYSGGAGVAVARQSVTGSYQTMIDAAIGDDDIPERAAIIETLGHVINSVMINWLSNGWDADRVAAVLDDAARALLRNR
ncbi:MAG: TetR family transcriptional regulator [Acidimicrobiales bacterium]|nr:TetR family transcriptional regulator [Acidimicrobiales bacterium]